MCIFQTELCILRDLVKVMRYHKMTIIINEHLQYAQSYTFTFVMLEKQFFHYYNANLKCMVYDILGEKTA